MDSGCPTPLVITGGMNTKKSSWCLRTATIEARKTGPLTARRRSEAMAWRFAGGNECLQSGGAWVAEVLAHGHLGAHLYTQVEKCPYQPQCIGVLGKAAARHIGSKRDMYKDEHQAGRPSRAIRTFGAIFTCHPGTSEPSSSIFVARKAFVENSAPPGSQNPCPRYPSCNRW